MWGPSEFVSTGTLRDYDRLERLRELKLPTLCVVGQYDEVRVIADAGHGLQRDQPQAFNDAVVEFITGEEKR